MSTLLQWKFTTTAFRRDRLIIHFICSSTSPNFVFPKWVYCLFEWLKINVSIYMKKATKIIGKIAITDFMLILSYLFPHDAKWSNMQAADMSSPLVLYSDNGVLNT